MVVVATEMVVILLNTFIGGMPGVMFVMSVPLKFDSFKATLAGVPNVVVIGGGLLNIADDALRSATAKVFVVVMPEAKFLISAPFESFICLAAFV